MRCVYPDSAVDSPERQQEGIPKAARPTAWNVGVASGILLPGEIKMEVRSADPVKTKLGFLATAEGDLVVWPSLSLGASLIYARAQHKLSASQSTNLVIASATVKKRFFLFKTFQLRSGVSIGYQRMISSVGELDNTNGLALSIFVQGVLAVTEHLSLMTQVGVLAQPFGRNAGNSVTYFPLVYAATGIEFDG